MIEKLNLENILFLDIETVPEQENFTTLDAEMQALWEAVQTAGPPVPTELRLLWEAASPKEAAAKRSAPAATAAAREAETAMAFPPDLQALWDAAVKLQELQELHHKPHKGEQ